VLRGKSNARTAQKNLTMTYLFINDDYQTKNRRLCVALLELNGIIDSRSKWQSFLIDMSTGLEAHRVSQLPVGKKSGNAAHRRVVTQSELSLKAQINQKDHKALKRTLIQMQKPLRQSRCNVAAQKSDNKSEQIKSKCNFSPSHFSRLCFGFYGRKRKYYFIDRSNLHRRRLLAPSLRTRRQSNKTL
jgi:hypothetical protein